MRLLRFRGVIIRIFVNFILCPFGFALDIIRRKESTAFLLTAFILIFIIYSTAISIVPTPFLKWFYSTGADSPPTGKEKSLLIFDKYMKNNYPMLPDIILAYVCVATESTILGGRYTPTKFYYKIFGLIKNCVSMVFVVYYVCPWEVHIPGWGGWVVWFTQNFYNVFLNIAICKFWTCSNDLRVYILTQEWSDTGYQRPFLLQSMMAARIVLFITAGAIFLLGFNFMIFLLMLMFVIGGFYICAFSFILPFSMIFAESQAIILVFYWLRRLINTLYMWVSGNRSLFLYPSTRQRLIELSQQLAEPAEQLNVQQQRNNIPLDDHEEDYYRLMDYDQEANGGVIDVHEHLRSEKSFMEGIQVVAMWIGYPLLLVSSLMLLEAEWTELQAFLYKPPFLGFNVFVIKPQRLGLEEERARLIAILLAFL